MTLGNEECATLGYHEPGATATYPSLIRPLLEYQRCFRTQVKDDPNQYGSGAGELSLVSRRNPPPP